MNTETNDPEKPLIEWLDETKLTVEILTDRSSNVNNLPRIADRIPAYTFGVSLAESWNEPANIPCKHWEVASSSGSTAQSGSIRADRQEMC